MDFEQEAIPTDADPYEYGECGECRGLTRHYHEDYRVWVHPECLGAWLGSQWP